MFFFTTFIPLLFLVPGATVSYAEDFECLQILAKINDTGDAPTSDPIELAPDSLSGTLSQKLATGCGATACGGRGLARALFNSLKTELIKERRFSKRTKGFAILIAAMVANAAASAYLTSALPAHFQFLSQLLAQVSAIGIYVAGAPIWEPISSTFRRLAFGISESGNRRELTGVQNKLEDLWRSTQQYSLNGQMSRNVLNNFLLTLQQSLYASFVELKKGEDRYAIDQIARSAIYMRNYFADISPHDDAVVMVVRTAFTNHLVNPSAFEGQVQNRITELDPEAETPFASVYYRELMHTWLNIN